MVAKRSMAPIERFYQVGDGRIRNVDNSDDDSGFLKEPVRTVSFFLFPDGERFDTKVEFFEEFEEEDEEFVIRAAIEMAVTTTQEAVKRRGEGT